jgi:hypothetical protein
MPRCGVGRQKWRSKDMHKTIFSKVLCVGGARASTVGLGVLLAVMLVLAAATAFPTPAGAVHLGDRGGPTAGYFNQEIAVDGCRELAREDIDEPCVTVDPSEPPYTVEVDTSWFLSRWDDPDRCKPGTTRQILARQVDNGPFVVVWEGTEPAPRGTASGTNTVRNGLQTSSLFPEVPPTTYRYRHTATCENPAGHRVQGPPTFSPAFWLHVLDNDAEITPLVLQYGGNWLPLHRTRAIGGTTHEAKEGGATATLRITALGVAWVTTVDEKSYPIEARVSSQPECDVSVQRLEACPRTVNTGEHDFGEERVVRWSLGWSNYQRGFNPKQIGENRPLKVEITSEERRIDVDAFVIAIRQE